MGAFQIVGIFPTVGLSLRLGLITCSLITKMVKCSQLNDELAYWQHYYNWEQVHGGIRQPPIEKLQQLRSQTPFWDEVITNYDPQNEQDKRH